MGFLSDKTKIPLGLAIIAIGGGAMWIATYRDQVVVNTKDIANLQSQRGAELAVLSQIQVDVAVIKAKVEVLAPYMRSHRSETTYRASAHANVVGAQRTTPITTRMD